MGCLDVARYLRDERSTYHDSGGDKREEDPIKLVRPTLDDEPE
jgi:hypothetical protein